MHSIDPLRDIANLVYVKIGIGIGAGLIINGHLYHGARKAAGELGHIFVKEKGKVCTCGSYGCLETVAAEPAIVKDAYKSISLRTSRPNSTQNPALTGSIDKVDIMTVIKAANDGDEASQIALKRAGEWIGRALSITINIINPSIILVDGDVIRKTSFLRDALQHSARESSLVTTWTELKITPSELKRPVAVGAVANVINRETRKMKPNE